MNNEIIYLLCLLNVGLVFLFLFEIKKLKNDYICYFEDLETASKENIEDLRTELLNFKSDVKSGLGERKIKYNNTVVFDCLTFEYEDFKTMCYIEANWTDRPKIIEAKYRASCIFDFERNLRQKDIDYRLIQVHKLN